jgi:hypothetical protein
MSLNAFNEEMASVNVQMQLECTICELDCK